MLDINRPAGRRRSALSAALLACLWLAGASLGQTQPAAGPGEGASAVSPPPATQPAKVTAAQVQELLPRATAPFDFSDTPLSDVIAYVSKTYSIRIYDDSLAGMKPDPQHFKDRVTMKVPGQVSARDAIELLDQMVLPLGCTVLEQLSHDEKPLLELRIIRVTDQAHVPVYSGMNPDRIPMGDDLRTQVIQLTKTEPEQVKEAVASVLDPKAEIITNPARRTIIITDTSSHIHTAASLIQVLEKQATEGKGH